MRNWLSGLALTAMAVAALFIGVGSQSANATVLAPTVSIVRVGTDAMGGDSFVNRNREYVLFKNTGLANTDVDGVTVMDNWRKSNLNNLSNCNKYTVNALPGQGSAAVLASNESVIVLNGWGTDKKLGNTYWLYAKSANACGLHGHYLNNDADTLYLMTNAADGVEITHKSWNWHGGYYVS